MDNVFDTTLGFASTLRLGRDTAMTRLPVLAALGGLVLLAACEAAPTANIATNTGDMREQQMRAEQLRAAQTNNPGMQNPTATGVGVGGIVRDQGTAGRGNVTAGAPVAVNPGTTGIERGDGVGAPRSAPRPPRRTTTPAT